MQDSKLRLINTSDHSEKPDLSEVPFEIGDEILEDAERLTDLVALGGGGRKETASRYGIIASVILHLFAFVVLLRMAYYVPSKSVLRPGEKVTKVRLVELSEKTKKDQPPPKQFSAISDRNNTAIKKRLPKRSTGTPVPMRPAPPRRMAMVKPPPAPEFPEKHKEKPKHTVKKKNSQTKRVAKPTKKKHTLKNPSTDFNISRKSVDLTPTMRERQLAFGGPSGAPSYFEDGDVEEAVVDLNTREAGQFGSYLLHVKRKIQQVWVYPRVAAEAGIGGRLTVEFVIAKDGKLVGTKLLNSSGHAILDQTAINAIEVAGPYNKFPPRFGAKRLRIRASFIYHNGGFFSRQM